MRLRALAPFLCCWVAAAAALALSSICSSLDSVLGRAVTIETFLRGDLHELATLRVFWFELRSWALLPFLMPLHHITVLCELRVALPIALLVGGMFVLWRRRGRTDFARAGMLCLCFALVPWFAGRYLLTGIQAPEQAGPHLVVMVAGLFWCGVGGALLCSLQLFARRTGGAPADESEAAAPVVAEA